jgi:hypothetical protein
LVFLICLVAVAGGARRTFAASPVEEMAVLERQLASDPENLHAAAAYRQLAIAAGAYDRAIKQLEALSRRPGAGAVSFLNLALAYVDKVPVSGAIRQVYLGRDAINAATRSIAIAPTDLAYLVRGLVNLYYDKFVFHRTDKGVADLEQARLLAAAHVRAPFVVRIYVALGDGYWRLDQPARARRIWQEGADLFPQSVPLHERLTSPAEALRGLIGRTLDADVRVDTTLSDVMDLPAPGSQQP